MSAPGVVRRGAAVPVLAAALALAACASGDDEASSADVPPEQEGGGSDLGTEDQDGGSSLTSDVQETLSQLNTEMRGADTVITLPEEVLFEFGESRLVPEATETLDAIAEAIDAAEGAPVQINGHTDAVGSDADNQALSEQRAQAVVDHLVSAGVDEGRVTAQGLGETQPVASNDTDDGRAQNRRVEIVVEGVDLSAVAG